MKGRTPYTRIAQKVEEQDPHSLEQLHARSLICRPFKKVQMQGARNPEE